MADNRPCKFYASGQKCRFGNGCKFLHQRNGPSSTTPSNSGTPQSKSRQNTTPLQTQGSSNAGTAARSPPQVCSIYWASGSCYRGFECSFKHTKDPRNETPDQDTARLSDPKNDLPDFFSIEGLAVTNSLVRHSQPSLNPSEVHNHIKQFLRDNYRFERASNCQSFVRIISSVNDRNKSWNSDNAQSFLEIIVKGNGIIRIGEILRFQPVTHNILDMSNNLSFQQGFFPLLEYLGSNLVLKSTWHKNINHLYTVVEENYDVIHDVIRSCMNSMIAQKSWKSLNVTANLEGVNVFKTLSTVLLQYFNRFKGAIRNHPRIVDLVQDISRWFDSWATGVATMPPMFDDSITELDARPRALMIQQVRDEIDRLITIVERESSHTIKLKRPTGRPTVTAEQRRAAETMRLGQTYDPPGELRPGGSRHDNDFVDISQIRIAPTHEELLAPTPPYLPVFSSEAPHHLPQDSMERHLDIQFRLLREELISTIRSALNAIHNDLRDKWESNGRTRQVTKLEALLSKNGGAYKSSGHDSVFFIIYTNVRFAPVRAERRDLTVGLLLDAPAGSARDPSAEKRAAYWKGSKRLQGGGLVALVIVSRQSLKVYLGVIASFGKDIAESSKASLDDIQVRITFFDPEVEFKALRRENLGRGASSYAILVDSSVMFEASRPFLEKLQTVEPTEIPFGRYISPGGSLADIQVVPPRYATNPRFRFKLQCLATDNDPRHRIDDLDISQPNAVNTARTQLLRSSSLDPSQVDAVINTMTREVSLIQGPPGTGKSFTGRELLRLLFASKVKPIVLIAYTNHALDHMLTEVLDAGITNKLVRLGSRSSDERIAEYTLDKLEQMAERTSLQRSIGRQYAVMKKLEEEMSLVMESIQLPQLSADQIEEYLAIHHVEHHHSLLFPPYWITELSTYLWTDEEEHGEWTTVDAKRKTGTVDKLSRTFYGLWKEGAEIQFLLPRPQQGSSEPKDQNSPTKDIDAINAPEEDPFVKEFFTKLDFGDYRPPLPTADRSLSNLKENPAVWHMSLPERQRLARSWEESIRTMAYDINLDRYHELRHTYKDACREYNEIRDETRRRLLSEVDLIACTTTGAAKLTSLINSIEPRVLMIEEAGQVLEAHVLTSLVPSVHHVIFIGDPQQLRPNLATFALSMDSERGKQLFKFDRSLMERLANSGLPMTQLNVQRRMRPSISHFIREILYPKLEDNDIVKRYPSVKGMQKDVYFLNHTNPEGGMEDSVSKYNMYEVQMIVDLVLYFLKQDVYSGAGDIAVLCAYLGQLQKVRQALKDLKLAVSLDDRDEEQLAKQGIEEEPTFEEVIVAKHIRLGTVDIFQGQEAKIVIVSLVRNTGNFDTNSGSIGFLKSSNRINVALSRAKHGMYIMGNASNLRKNDTWSTIIDELEARDQIGPGLPIVCPRHAEQVKFVTKPGELKRYAPEGGCLLPCGYQLTCGHICPSVCHPTLDNHRTVYCHMSCNRTPCPRSHPCLKECSADCGDCEFPIYNVELLCGHLEEKVACHMLEKLDEVKCTKMVIKKLPRCEHSAKMQCHKDPSSFMCKEICAGIMEQCCSKTCKSHCSDCHKETTRNQAATLGPIVRTAHKKHPCERPLYCLHACGLDCHSKDTQCNPSCNRSCRQECLHQSCRKPCSTPCTPCMEPCIWQCEHKTCPVTCGSICTRLPCDEPCKFTLPCGHPCPSICGEPCDQQRCVGCLAVDEKREIVDFIMQRRLEEIDYTSSDVAERLITLKCGHVFTVETLDGHCNMTEFYDIDQMGSYLATKVPPTDYQTPPTCPACRGPITALRYGRVFKRSTLDILEQNVASTMSRSLDDLGPAMEDVTNSLGTYKESAKKMAKHFNNMRSIAHNRLNAAIGITTEPLPRQFLSRNEMHMTHGFSPDEALTWSTITQPIFKAYHIAHKISTTRGAHVQAYEGAFTTLYRLELEAIANDPSCLTDSPEPLALTAVQKNIGQPPPKADSRFQIEAYFRTLELRFMLADVGLARIETLSSATADEASRGHEDRWTTFVGVIYKSCVADSKKALEMAQKSSASRQAARCKVLVIRSNFEIFRFRTIVAAKTLKISSPNLTENREALAKTVADTKVDMNSQLVDHRQEYLRSRPAGNMATLREELKWFDDQCSRKVERFTHELDELEEFVRKGGGYEPLSLSEKEDIVKAFGFATSGHFYNCENGHPFVITECGGAMATSRCPECGVAIGGGSHRLLDTNTVAPDFEGILRGTGVAQGFY